MYEFNEPERSDRPASGVRYLSSEVLRTQCLSSGSIPLGHRRTHTHVHPPECAGKNEDRKNTPERREVLPALRYGEHFERVHGTFLFIFLLFSLLSELPLFFLHVYVPVLRDLSAL